MKFYDMRVPENERTYVNISEDGYPFSLFGLKATRGGKEWISRWPTLPETDGMIPY